MPTVTWPTQGLLPSVEQFAVGPQSTCSLLLETRTLYQAPQETWRTSAHATKDKQRTTQTRKAVRNKPPKPCHQFRPLNKNSIQDPGRPLGQKHGAVFGPVLLYPPLGGLSAVNLSYAQGPHTSSQRFISRPTSPGPEKQMADGHSGACGRSRCWTAGKPLRDSGRKHARRAFGERAAAPKTT